MRRHADWPYAAGLPEGRPYDVSPDEQRFRAISQGAVSGGTVEIVIIQNWIEDLKRQVPTVRDRY